VRFTPAGVCQVKSANIYSYNTGGTQTCSLYIWDNQSGLPGTERAKVAYNPIVQGWQTVNLPTPVVCSTDFLLGVEVPATGTVYVVTDLGLNSSDRMAWKLTGGTWGLASDAMGDFRIRAIVDYEGIEETHTDAKKTVLMQNAPNPVFKGTTISYTLSENTKVKINIYNIAGKMVRTLVDNTQPVGINKTMWDKRNQNGEIVPSGIYFYILSTEKQSFRKTMIVL
jgi:hypothetical protein